jgi:hypothetical protein
MKNVTIALDDETHRKARIRAAELGTSLSALVKDYLNRLAEDAAPPTGVREMPMEFKHAEPQPHGPPWLVDGKWVYTRDGKPRKPGALRRLPPLPDDWDDWPKDILDSFEAWPYDDPDFDPLPFSEDQLPKK